MTFKKGQSGNPSGKALWKPYTDALNWAGKLTPKEIRERKGKNGYQAAALAWFREQLDGNVQAMTAAADRLEGKPIQSVQTTNDAETLALQAYNTEMLRQLSDLIKPQLEAPIIDVTPDDG